jgi:hypothetical protein
MRRARYSEATVSPRGFPQALWMSRGRTCGKAIQMIDGEDARDALPKIYPCARCAAGMRIAAVRFLRAAFSTTSVDAAAADLWKRYPSH